jgi:glycine/D-amino acid oxidase-like deaminating enzyme
VRSSSPYWLLRNGIGDAHEHCPLPQSCDVAIIGAGITGALVGDALVATGARIVILDADEPGQGSTAASTAFLQYEIDTHLAELTARFGAERATLAYRACFESFMLLEQRFPDLLGLADYDRRGSLYLADGERALPALRAEFAARSAIGIDCEWIDEDGLARRFGCRRPGGILSARGAQIDPLRLTRALLAGCARHGVEVRTRARVAAIDDASDLLALRLESGGTLQARHVIVCAGYESLEFLPQSPADVHNTFALVTEPVDDPAVATMPLIWETARPYLYMRATADHRLIVGGADVPFRNAGARELLLPRQVRQLAKGYSDLFGRELPPVAYTWAGSFAETADGLPYIGPAPGLPPRLQFALCYGGNGITYSVYAGDIVRAHMEGRAHALDEVFGFGRSGAEPARFVQAKEESGDPPRIGSTAG